MLETGELLGEPLPTRDNRRAILFYEAAEGGAGVLKRLMDGPERWQKLAEVALELMHYVRKDGELIDGEAPCVDGCYRCLLSYYNQPDHELISRRDPDVIAVLDQLARCEKDRPARTASDKGTTSWETALARWGAPPPVREVIAGQTYPLCWPEAMVMAVAGKADPALEQRCAAIGRELIELPDEPGDTIPANLAAALGVDA